MRAIRLFAILDQLRGRRHPVSAAVLAKAMDVSERTIYRDMSTLQAMGAPIRGEGGIGYQLEKGYFLPPLHFDPDELDAVILGMRMVAARGDDPLAAAALRALGKIGSVLPDLDRDQHRQKPLLAHSAQQSQGVAFLSMLRTCIRDRQRIHMSYSDLKGRPSSREIRPLGLTAFDAVWLLTAWCEKRSDFRNFRVDRIETAQPTGTTFRFEAGKEFGDYLKTL